MDITVNDLKVQGLEKKPDFYRNISGMPAIKRTNSGGVVNSSVVPIVRHINERLVFEPDATFTSWNNVTIGHGNNAIYYAFIRWRVLGDSAWTMCPQIAYSSAGSDVFPIFFIERYEKSSIEFNYFDINAIAPTTTRTIEVDIYFVDILFNI